VKWMWADDARAHQDRWVDYDPALAAKIEAVFLSGKSTFKVDPERYLDFSDRSVILQRRYDDPSKRRAVRRIEREIEISDDSDSDSDSEVEIVQWLWADDSPTGRQNEWKEYDPKTTKKIEKAFKAKEKIAKIDENRYIDLEDTGGSGTNFLQRRFDDTNKRRAVRRQISKKRKASKPSDSGRSKKKART